VSHKSRKIAGLIESFETGEFDPHYLGFFDCFNRQLFFEAHEVLEELWLGQRGRPKDLFYKGLIQLAGAFVHVQKRRRQPALALLKLARANLVRFPTPFDGLELLEVLQLIDSWSGCLEAHPHLDKNLAPNPWPRLEIR
jgi:predicted metal-dependent hydrolase